MGKHHEKIDEIAVFHCSIFLPLSWPILKSQNLLHIHKSSLSISLKGKWIFVPIALGQNSPGFQKDLKKSIIKLGQAAQLFFASHRFCYTVVNKMHTARKNSFIQILYFKLYHQFSWKVNAALFWPLIKRSILKKIYGLCQIGVFHLNSDAGIDFRPTFCSCNKHVNVRTFFK